MNHVKNAVVIAASLYGCRKQYEQARKTDSYLDWAQFGVGVAATVITTIKAVASLTPTSR